MYNEHADGERGRGSDAELRCLPTSNPSHSVPAQCGLLADAEWTAVREVVEAHVAGVYAAPTSTAAAELLLRVWEASDLPHGQLSAWVQTPFKGSLNAALARLEERCQHPSFLVSLSADGRG